VRVRVARDEAHPTPDIVVVVVVVDILIVVRRASAVNDVVTPSCSSVVAFSRVINRHWHRLTDDAGRHTTHRGGGGGGDGDIQRDGTSILGAV
jgi:hypothetical protein